MEAVGFTKSSRRRFNDAEYMLSISGDTDSLSVEVEHAEDGRRWRARFAAGFVEEITRRTGNAKKFDVFVRMLLSALAQESDSVYLDVLTARDLEMLRRHANPQGPPSVAPATTQPDKRYMILTYRAEFDKVHYPLPLALDERSEEDVLRSMVARLRSELSQAQETISQLQVQKPPPPPPDVVEDERMAKLHSQNKQLADSLHAMQKEADQLRAELRLRTAGQQDQARAEEASRLKTELTRSKAEVKSLKDELKQRELAQKRSREKEAAELKAERQKAERLQAQLKKLEEEKRTLAARIGRGPSVDRSRPVSRTPSAERARPPSRPLSGSRPVSRPPPRPSSRASSAASSRERTPSPSSFLQRRGRPNAGPPPRGDSQGRRSPALNRSGSPGLRREEGAREERGYSPGSSVSPYRRPAGGSRSRERTPSPGSQRRVAPPNAVNGRGASALSLRERSGDPGIGVGPKPPSSRYGGTVRPPAAPAEAPTSRPHEPGSLFGLAANLGLGGGPPAPPVDEAEACDIDARLQALQSFLKQTKNIAA